LLNVKFNFDEWKIAIRWRIFDISKHNNRIFVSIFQGKTLDFYSLHHKKQGTRLVSDENESKRRKNDG
jgi:hypothetical protein